MAITMNWKDENGRWVMGPQSAGGGAGQERSVEVYQPNQWEPFRQLQSGAAYGDDVLQRYLTGYVDPTFDRMAIENIARARNSYGPSPSNYFSAATLNAQNKAGTDVAFQQGTTRANAALNWADTRNKMMAQMLDQRPIEKSFIPEPARFDASQYGGGSSSYGSSYTAPRKEINLSPPIDRAAEERATRKTWYPDDPSMWG